MRCPWLNFVKPSVRISISFDLAFPLNSAILIGGNLFTTEVRKLLDVDELFVVSAYVLLFHQENTIGANCHVAIHPFFVIKNGLPPVKQPFGSLSSLEER